MGVGVEREGFPAKRFHMTDVHAELPLTDLSRGSSMIHRDPARAGVP